MESGYIVTLENDIAKITLTGRLDATNAPAFQEELKKLIGKKINQLVFFAKDLEYISSAGLRMIIFAKQKIGPQATVYFIGAQEAVLNVITMSGLDTFMTIQATFAG
jgi:anti-anti-sigma factor